MLKVIGHIYSNSNDSIKKLANAMENEGYEVAYENELGASVIENIPDEEEDVNE